MAPDIGIPSPDKVFYLRLSATAAKDRAIYGEERYEKVAFQEEVKDQFEAMKGSDWVDMDASRDIDSLHQEILEKTLQVIDRCQGLPIAKLWSDSVTPL